MTWHEILEQSSGGFWQYWTNWFNYGDILQLILYWSALVCRTLSYVKVIKLYVKSKVTLWKVQFLVIKVS